jgi:hypothetical protein
MKRFRNDTLKHKIKVVYLTMKESGVTITAKTLLEFMAEQPHDKLPSLSTITESLGPLRAEYDPNSVAYHNRVEYDRTESEHHGDMRCEYLFNGVLMPDDLWGAGLRSKRECVQWIEDNEQQLRVVMHEAAMKYATDHLPKQGNWETNR